MKRVLFSAAALISAVSPIAAHAAPAVPQSVTVSKQAVCERVIVVLDDGRTVDGMLCYMVDGRT